MDDIIIDQLEDEILNPPPYNPEYEPGLNNAVNHYLRLEEIPSVHVRPEIHSATAMLVLGNRRQNRILHRPQIHVQDISPIHENEPNIQVIKQENNGNKPQNKKVVKPTSDFSGYESESSYYSEDFDRQKSKKHSKKRPDRMYDPLNPHGNEDQRRHEQHHDRHENRYKHDKDKTKSSKERQNKRDNSDKEDRHKDRQNFSMPRRMNRRGNSSGPSSSSSSSDTELDRRTPSTNRDNRNRETRQENNLLGNILSESQMWQLKLLLHENTSTTDLNTAKIINLIPNNLVWGSCQHERIHRQVKILGKIPPQYGEKTNNYTFFSTFKYLEEYEIPFTHSSYNNILIHYFNTESRNKLDMLEIDPNALSAQDFVKSILTTIGAELLNPHQYEKQFYTYRFTAEDEDKPNKIIVYLAAMLQKTGNSHENQMAKLREKICTYLVPPLLQSAFLTSTNVPYITKETILSWFSNNRSFYNSAIERKRKLDRQKNANVNQVEKEKTCEHCQKPHYSRYCLKHPDEAVKKANMEWWYKKNKEKANSIVCLLCNSDTHGSGECFTFPNVNPSKDQCPRCLNYGVSRLYHPLSACKFPPTMEKN